MSEQASRCKRLVLSFSSVTALQLEGTLLCRIIVKSCIRLRTAMFKESRKGKADRSWWATLLSAPKAQRARVSPQAPQPMQIRHDHRLMVWFEGHTETSSPSYLGSIIPSNIQALAPIFEITQPLLLNTTISSPHPCSARKPYS